MTMLKDKIKIGLWFRVYRLRSRLRSRFRPSKGVLRKKFSYMLFYLHNIKGISILTRITNPLIRQRLF